MKKQERKLELDANELEFLDKYQALQPYKSKIDYKVTCGSCGGCGCSGGGGCGGCGW